MLSIANKPILEHLIGKLAKVYIRSYEDEIVGNYFDDELGTADITGSDFIK